MQKQVKPSAISLLVLGALGLLLELLSVVLPGADLGEMADQMKQAGLSEDQANLFLKFVQWGSGVGAVLFIAGSAFIVFAATRMMALRNWGLAVTASILAMLPCFTSCCCVLGVPVGIWALIVLLNKDVKAAFEAGSGTPAA